MGKVTVVMPCRDAGKFLRPAISSVLGQSNERGYSLELLIADDASSDAETVRALHDAVADPRVRVLRSDTPKGAAAARNTALRAATGDYVAFLDADDVWAPDHLETHLKLRDEFSSTFTSTDYDIIDQEGNIVVHGALLASPKKGARLQRALGNLHHVSIDRPRRLFVDVCPAWTGSVVVDRVELARSEGFDERRRYAEDVDLWTRLSAHCRFALSSAVTAQHRRNPRSLVSTAEEGTVDMALADTYLGLQWHDDFRDLRRELREVAAANFFSAAYALRRSNAEADALRCAWQGLQLTPFKTRGYRELLRALCALPDAGRRRT